MPELPEVESIKLQLEKYLVGHKVEKVEIKHPKIFTGDPKKIEGAKLKAIRRFGKALCFDLDNGYSILSHIKLTGQFIYRGPNLKKPPVLSKKVVDGISGKHTHVIFNLDKGGKLYYNDVRRFGWIKIEKTSEVENESFISRLGPEPFGSAQGKPGLLTFDYFKTICGKTKRAVKVLLMDQSKMGGVGNIYANDALWDARIDPKHPANSLSDTELKTLFKSIEKVLKKGLETGGASELAFVTPDGTEGSYQDHTLVYGKEGNVCKNCKENKIEKYMLGGRGTYWCPTCQN